MRLQATRCLVLLATVTVAGANDVVSFLYPERSFPSDAKLIGTTGGALTTLVFNCAEVAPITLASVAAPRSSAAPDDDDQCWVPDADYTITAGSTTFEFAYTTHGFTISAGCSFASTTYASCKAISTFVSDTGIQSFDSSSRIPHMTVTITATESVPASATASVTSSSVSKTTASDIGSTTLGSSVLSSATSTSTVDTSDNAAMPLATGTAQWVAGGAAMMLALAIA
ncbi:hypothetical protein BDV38DRAFT_276905 [Aspergillus pseudotamarii]|uniref:GPI anchored cell wall protein n=1 Tax=Aspergillus pseudotamarii TaxID=132259 RepID=A0A5N6TC04_ASPPS|nr:uncharacterized protein BDV38DRAFT_276905 [Aspergillus pseudotamarii]KAE8143836.1 hypothetical protein BDV38DRAFT_276905 [Aspergillus pseudotamarii]